MLFRINTKKEIDENAPLECGIYRIFWLKKGERQPIGRIGGIDETGLLYVGHTQGTLRNRLNQFRCSAFLNSTNHSGGKKFRLNPKIQETIGPDELFAEVVPEKNSHDFEIDELKRYTDNYGEVPPLNG